MIELRKNSEKFYFDVIIDGKSYNRVYASGNDDFDYHSENKEASQILIDYKLNEFPSFKEIWLEDVFPWFEYEHTLWIRFDYSKKVKTKKLLISFVFEPRLLFWNKNYSFKQYSNIFGAIWSLKKRFGDFEYYEEEQPLFSIEIVVLRFESSINEFVSPYLEELKSVHQEVLETLSLDTNQTSLKTFFEFPDEIKVFCRQYLEYFAKFLQDLGINAASSLKEEEAGKVLFSVTPTDDVEALDKIREALAVYLNLPSNPILYNDSFQSMQLKQQVENLQHSQRMKEMEIRSAQYALRLAQQNIENQDKIITRQNSFIDNQNKIIEKITSKSIMIDSLENKEELEKFCDGFEVGKSEFLIKHFGLHLNPATVLKNVGKKILGKDESKSILDLNEETNQENN